MTENFARKFYLTVLIIFMVIFALGGVAMFLSPVIPLSGALIYAGVGLFIETFCAKYLIDLLRKD